jgi:hypothetical protein
VPLTSCHPEKEEPHCKSGSVTPEKNIIVIFRIIDLAGNYFQVFESKGVIYKIFGNKDLAPQRPPKILWGSLDVRRAFRRTSLETAPNQSLLSQWCKLEVNDYCGRTACQTGSLPYLGMGLVCPGNRRDWIPSMWSILWNGFHICKSCKSCWIKSCYTPPTRPRSALSETGPLWYATRCGNISAGWNCEPVKSATARATRDVCRPTRKPTRKRGVGNRRPRGRKNRPRPDSPRHIPG